MRKEQQLYRKYAPARFCVLCLCWPCRVLACAYSGYRSPAPATPRPGRAGSVPSLLRHLLDLPL